MTLCSGRDAGELFELVTTYDAFGTHRTGTAPDEATTAWLAELLGAHLDVDVVGYDFDRFDWTCAVAADGELVESLPLFYEGVGSIRTTEAEIAAVETFVNFAAPDLDARIAETEAPVLLAATTGPSGELVAFNRATTVTSGTPTVLVPGRDHERLAAASAVEVTYDASVIPGRSANVLATGGPTDAPHVVLTTPLTGWFTCAGERGPGIALLADLAPRLADHVHLTVIAASGHELHHVGARAWLDHLGDGLHPDVVVHLGASIATGPAADDFSGQSVQTQLPADLDAAIESRYLGSDQRFAGRPEAWISEAKEWVDRCDRVLSYTGTFPLFHTPADRADVSTSPARLADAASRLDAAVGILLGALP